MPTLDWIGKKAVVNHHQEVPYHLLKCDNRLSVGDPGSGNLLVQGDNLIALKALLPYYGGQVKCIYIDPPYNTGNENWVYNDAVNSSEIKSWLGKTVGKEAEDLSRHDKWLSMMYPRLELLKRFLRSDGVILVSIDDNELVRLRLLMEEIFGEPNSIATLVWEKGKKGDAKFVSETHEYVVIFARSKATLLARGIRWRREKPGVDKVLSHYAALRREYRSQDDKIRNEMMKWFRELRKGDPARAHKHYNWSDKKGLYFAADFAGPDDGRKNRPRYSIFHPLTGKPCTKPSTGWRWDEERTQRALREDPPRIHFGPDENTIPCRKTYLFEVSEEPFQSVFYKDGRAATLEVEQMLGSGAFSFPKDSDIIADLLGLMCDKDDIILDSFAGSGTTGHAVLKLNNRDNGNRRFVLIEMEEEICRRKARDRLVSAIEGYVPKGKKEKGKRITGLGSGLRYCMLGEPLFDGTGQICKTVTYTDLARHVFFTETGEPLPKKPSGKNSPLIGLRGDTAYYLLFNGILGDRSADGGNVLTGKILAMLPRHKGSRVVFGEGCRLSLARLKRERVTFKQIPYEIKVT